MTEPKDADALAKLLSSLTNLPASGPGDDFDEPSAEELAFLEAEMSGVEYDDDDDFDDDDEEEDDDMGGLEALLRAASQSAAPTGPECQTLSEIDEATRFLKILIDQQHLELEPGADLRTLATAGSQYICGNANPELRAKELIGWLLKADGVYDVFCKDEIIVDLLAQW